MQVKMALFSSLTRPDRARKLARHLHPGRHPDLLGLPGLVWWRFSRTLSSISR